MPPRKRKLRHRQLEDYVPDTKPEVYDMKWYSIKIAVLKALKKTA